MSKEVIKNTKFNKLNTKVNNLVNKIPGATTLIYINQYNTDKQSLEKKVGNIKKKKKPPEVSSFVSTTVRNTKIGEVERKIPDVSVIAKKANYNAQISDIEAKYFTTCDCNKFTSEILETRITEKD